MDSPLCNCSLFGNHLKEKGGEDTLLEAEKNEDTLKALLCGGCCILKPCPVKCFDGEGIVGGSY